MIKLQKYHIFNNNANIHYKKLNRTFGNNHDGRFSDDF